MIRTEIRYGGYVTNIPKKTSSRLDPSKAGFLTGGDRTLTHGYAELYAKHLSRFLQAGSDLTIVEIGILQRTGLSVWCDLFPEARVIWLDIDLSNYQGNLSELKQRGAFQHNQPEVFEFDQFLDTRSTWAGSCRAGELM